MRSTTRSRPTIGVLVSWPVYYGTRIMWYQHTVLQGIYASAIAHDCNLLLACGMDAIPSPPAARPVWPTLIGDTPFVPVGPWNTDGLIVVAMSLDTEQKHYFDSLAADGYPLVYTAFDGPGLFVNIDSPGGIFQALAHLRAHGHQRIAFIAGGPSGAGESGARFQAYLEMTRAMGLDTDPRLIAYGDLLVQGGRHAMREILARGVPFTAVLASNDASAFGAAQVLQERGLHIPDDVAMIGFDDVLEARAHVPALTTVYNPAFTMGRQALRTMLDVLAGRPPEASSMRVPVRLVIRRSCGCRPPADRIDAASIQQPAVASSATLAQAMAEAVQLEAGTRSDEVASVCRGLVDSFIASVHAGDDTAFEDALLDVLHRSEATEDDVQAWLGPLITLRHGLTDLLPLLSVAARTFAEELLNQACQIVSERTRHQATRVLNRTSNAPDRLGLMVVQLLATLDRSQIPAILAEHLPWLNVAHLLGALFIPNDDDPIAQAELMLSYGLAGTTSRQRFSTRQFPPPALYPPDQSFQLALLPLFVQEMGTGFVAFDAANLEPCGAIIRNLAAALRGGHLYAKALYERQQAETADRLKTRLLANVSHELRTPLSIILGYSHAALAHSNGPKPDMLSLPRTDLQHIASSAEHLLRLINDLLDLSRAEIGVLDLFPELIPTRSVLHDVFSSMAASAASEGHVTWHLDLPEQLPVIEADAVRVRQIVLNLLSNAAKFTQIGKIVLGAEVLPPHLHIWVRDTGTGIPVDLQERIFEPFVSAAQGGWNRGNVGLGLAITRQLVALHGGAMTLESQPHQGSTFHVYLPLGGVHRAQVRSGIGREPALLIISTHAEPPPALAAWAKRLGARVHRLSLLDDPEAVRQEILPVALAWDLTEAGHEAWTVIERFRACQEYIQTPLLLYNREHENILNLPLGMTNVLTKPVAQQAFLGSITALHQPEAMGPILIVDDDAQTRAYYHDLISGALPEFPVRSAANGAAALSSIAKETPSLVILDLMMPEVDGFEVLAQLRREPRTQGVPVLVMSGHILSLEDIKRLDYAHVVVHTKELWSEEETIEQLRQVLVGTTELPQQTSRVVKRAVASIQQQYAKRFSRKQIAAAVGVHPDYLSTIFRQELGLSPVEYLHRYRMVQAKTILRSTDVPIAAVAAQVGFDDPNYFSRVFRNVVGRSPRAYREQPD